MAVLQQIQNIFMRKGNMTAICHSCRVKLGNRMLLMSSASSSHVQNFQEGAIVRIAAATSSHERPFQSLYQRNLSYSPASTNGIKSADWTRQFSISLSDIRSQHSSNFVNGIPQCTHIHTLRERKFSTASCPFGNPFTNTLRLFSTTSRAIFQSSDMRDVKDTTAFASDGTAEEQIVKELSQALLAQERWALAKAITLVEATHRKGRRQAQVLLREVLHHLADEQSKNKGVSPSFRIGLTGPPGAGKSTFIEALGRKLTAEGHRVAVLAVDPSSSITGGSLLGDKTRMTELSRDPQAYIRASPSSGTLGGVTRNTNDTILLCEAGGYDVILVETIGVGQSEYAVADMVDMLVLLIPPAGGDELQGLKKGIVERADFILINKADGELLVPARRMRSEYTSAVKLMYKRSKLWSPKVKQVSSKTGEGLAKAWDIMEEYRSIMVGTGEFSRKRQLQRRVWMWQHIRDQLMEEFRGSQGLRGEIAYWEGEVMGGRCTPGVAADELLKKFAQMSREL